MKASWVMMAALLVLNTAQAERPKSKKEQQPTKTEQATSPRASPKPTGPTGFGPIKLGMTKEAIEALKESDGTYPLRQLFVAESTQPQPEGTTMYKAPVRTPLGNVPINMVFTFSGEQLSKLVFLLEDPYLERVKSQIAEKYGPGRIDNGIKEEQCIYRNGGNFNISAGTRITQWLEPATPTEQIETEVKEVVIDACPTNLGFGRLGPTKVQTMVIRRVPATEVAKTNLF